MKKIMCLFVMFLISNAANAEEWEYVQLRIGFSKTIRFTLSYPDGKKDMWEVGELLILDPKTGTFPKPKHLNPPKNFEAFAITRFRHRGLIDKAEFDKMIKKDFSSSINVVNILGKCGFEITGYSTDSWEKGSKLASQNTIIQDFWFKRKISK